MPENIPETANVPNAASSPQIRAIEGMMPVRSLRMNGWDKAFRIREGVLAVRGCFSYERFLPCICALFSGPVNSCFFMASTFVRSAIRFMVFLKGGALFLSFAVICLGGCSSEQSEDNGSGVPSTSDAPTPVIIDSDANNELDDQHALAYALLSGDRLQVRGITVNRTDNGGDIDAQMAEAERVVRLTGLSGSVPIREGASGAYDDIAPSVSEDTFDGAEAVNFIIEEAHASGEGRLVLIPIGKLTNVALALKKDPSIASEIRVLWLGSNFPAAGEYNLENDPSAVNPVIESDVPFEIAVVRYGRSSGTAAVQTFQSEIREVMPGLGPSVKTPVTGRHGGTHTTFGDYSVALFDHVDDESRALYDVAAVAVVKEPEWGVRRSVGGRRLEDGEWVRAPDGEDVIIWELFYGSKIIQDLFGTLRDPVPAVDTSRSE